MSRKSTIFVNEGVIPERPEALIPPPQEFMTDSNEETVVNLLKAGRVVAFGGVSIVGERGSVVVSIGIYQVINTQAPEGADLQGWSLFLGRVEQPRGLQYLNTERDINTMLVFPNWMTYFVGEVTDTALLEESGSRKQLRAIVRFILPFISDDGPPEELLAAWEA